jgi:hypothetical protein
MWLKPVELPFFDALNLMPEIPVQTIYQNDFADSKPPIRLTKPVSTTQLYAANKSL